MFVQIVPEPVALLCLQRPPLPPLRPGWGGEGVPQHAQLQGALHVVHLPHADVPALRQLQQDARPAAVVVDRPHGPA